MLYRPKCCIYVVYMLHIWCMHVVYMLYVCCIHVVNIICCIHVVYMMRACCIHVVYILHVSWWCMIHVCFKIACDFLHILVMLCKPNYVVCILQLLYFWVKHAVCVVMSVAHLFYVYILCIYVLYICFMYIRFVYMFYIYVLCIYVLCIFIWQSRDSSFVYENFSNIIFVCWL